MRYRLPEDCSGVTYDGTSLAAAADGTIESDAAAAPHLAPHGIEPLEEEPPKASPGPAAGRKAKA